MKLKIFAVKDVRTEAFMRPFFVQNHAVLQRAILDAKNDEHNTISFHPEDYQVFELGEYDDGDGAIRLFRRSFCSMCVMSMIGLRRISNAWSTSFSDVP